APSSAAAPGGAPAPDGSSSPEYRTVLEAGRPPLRCRVVRRWRIKDGPTPCDACELQSTQTGEMLTIVETAPAEVPGAAPGTNLKAMPARIFHWGRYKERPAGVPAPPGSSDTVVSKPLPNAPVVTAQPAVVNVERGPQLSEQRGSRPQSPYGRL